MNSLSFSLRCTLLLVSLGAAAPALAAKPTALPATYAYEDVMPGFRTEIRLKATRACAAGERATLVSEEWTKETSVQNRRKGGRAKLRDRAILVRQSCERAAPVASPAPGPSAGPQGAPAKQDFPTERSASGDSKPLIFAIENDGKEVLRVHTTLLDGLEAIETETSRSASGGAKKPR